MQSATEPTYELPLANIDIHDDFWLAYQQLIRDVVIPYQWAALNDRVDEAEPSHAIENFRIAAGQRDGEFYGMVFQDSDVAKWLEAVGYLLNKQPDAALEQTADEVIELVAAVQQPDGYLNTYFTVKEPAARWTNLAECHELYCAGHLIEAAVAYYHGTGKRRLLDVACKLADHIDSVFGTEAGKLPGYPGHPEIELALTRLYEVTQEPRYLALAAYFVAQRGTQPHFYDEEYARRGFTSYWQTHGPAWMVKDKAYSQAHQPLAEQQVAVGHAVRFVYLLTGVAHLAQLSNDAGQRAICRRLWDNMAQKQLYITGAIGAQSSGEAFSSDYDLPPDTAYNETCASIGLMMFARRMLHLEADRRYADVMERALYNTVLAGMALDGKHFFYVNPLEVQPQSCRHNHIYDHVKPVRQRWFGCACCPPNIARLLASLGQYIYTQTPEALLVNLYIGSEARVEIGGQGVTLRQRGDYLRQGEMRLSLAMEAPASGTLALRLPGWCAAPQVTVNGEAQDVTQARQGYLWLTRRWQPEDEIVLTLPMEVRRVKAAAPLRHAAGQVALQRGPLVYCLEEADNGRELHNLLLPPDAAFSLQEGDGVLAGKTLIRAAGQRVQPAAPDAALYQFDPAPAPRTPQTLTFIPYFAWANRGEGEMRVWVREG
jgi:DUF1680 family protein